MQVDDEKSARRYFRLRKSIKRAPPSATRAQLPGSGMFVVTLPLIISR